MEVVIEPKSKKDRSKLRSALSSLAKEDPALSVATDGTTGQTILKGMSEDHLEPIVLRIKEEYEIEVRVGAPQVIYQHDSLVISSAARLWEPLMLVRVVTPEAFSAVVARDAINRRGEVIGKSKLDNGIRVDALVPLANLGSYKNALRSMTQGRSTYTMEFARYAPVPLPDDDPPKRPAVIMRDRKAK
jgi:translation elongation factor EF-G